MSFLGIGSIGFSALEIEWIARGIENPTILKLSFISTAIPIESSQ
jgi:hypothetical protein